MPSNSGSFSPSAAPDVVGQEDSTNSRKPDNTAFKQQRLPAWQPIVTAQSVLPVFFTVSAIFIALGVILVVASNNIVEVSSDYTDCTSAAGVSCTDLRSNNSATTMAQACSCSFSLTVDQDMTGDVFVYYGLTNFFQNHRRYVRSRDDAQLNGQSVTADTISSDCEPYRRVNSTSSLYYAPAGAIANSMFNDTFTIADSAGSTISIIRTGIAWPTDHNQKFNNPSTFDGSTRPPYWQVSVDNLDSSNQDNNGYENEGLIVWMRTAAFATFRKPYGRITTGVLSGEYTVTVDYNFPVVAFDGTKRFILSTTSWIGGKNLFLGIAYIVVGGLCFISAIALCIVHNMTKKKNVASTAPR